MKTRILILMLSLAYATVSFAHHAAVDIIDEETWAMIDELVADTPHASLDLTDLGNAMDMEIMLPSADQDSLDSLVSELDLLASENGSEYYISLDEVGNMTVITLSIL